MATLVQSSNLTTANRRRAVVAAAIGNVVEWYDWTIYALFAVYFAEQFFPSSNELASLLATFTVFAVGFIARPVGSIFLGRVSDRLGRRAALSTSVLLMAAASLGIAVVPTAESIGIGAAIILLALRLIQGFSLGGETSAVGSFLAETAPRTKRGFFTSTYSATIMIGTLIGSLVGLTMTTLLPHEAMLSFGWRIPFLIGGLLGIIGFFIRRGTHETLDLSKAPDPHPIRTIATTHRRSAGVTFALVAGAGVSFFGLIAGFPALAKVYGISSTEAFAANVLGLVVLIILIPVFARLSDRIGRRKVMTIGMLGMALTAIPSVWLLSQGYPIAGQLLIAIPAAAAQSVLMISLVERFPSALRGSGYGFFFATTIALVGGTAPMISTALAANGLLMLFPAYIAMFCAIGGVVAWRMRETAFEPLLD